MLLFLPLICACATGWTCPESGFRIEPEGVSFICARLAGSHGGPVSPVAPPIPRMNSFLLLFTLLAWLVHDDDEHLFQIWRRGDLMALMFHDSTS
jgi:hypothetical protein